MNTWERNPQDPTDDHDWTLWFADPRPYRDINLLTLASGDLDHDA